VAAIGHYRSDRRVIFRQLKSLTALLEKGGAEPPLASWGVAREVASLFAPGFLVSAPPYEGRLTDPQQLAAAVHRLRDAAVRIEVTVGSRELEVRANGTSELHFVSSVILHRPQGVAHESYRVRTQWQKDEGRWRINELELLEVLEGRGLLGL
jgi:hypothetical protein